MIKIEKGSNLLQAVAIALFFTAIFIFSFLLYTS